MAMRDIGENKKPKKRKKPDVKKHLTVTVPDAKESTRSRQSTNPTPDQADRTRTAPRKRHDRLYADTTAANAKERAEKNKKLAAGGKWYRIGPDGKEKLAPDAAKKFKESASKATAEGYQPVLKAMEITARPSHAQMGALNSVVQNAKKRHLSLKAPAKEALKGVTGKQQTGFGEVMSSAGVLDKHDKIRGAIGFVGDTAFDPTTYLVGGAGGVARTAAEKAGIDAAKAARKAGGDVAAQEAARKTAGDAVLAAGEHHAGKGIQIGFRLPGGKKFMTSGQFTAGLNQRLGGAGHKVATKARESGPAQKVGTRLDPNFRRKGVPEDVHREGRHAAREHRAHNDREQEKAAHLRTSIEKAVPDEAERTNLTAAIERAPTEDAIPETVAQSEVTEAHTAKINLGRKRRAEETAKRQNAKAQGRAVNEERHRVQDRVMAPEHKANEARDRAAQALHRTEQSTGHAERDLTRKVLEHDEDYVQARSTLGAAVTKRNKLRTHYGNEARSIWPVDDAKLTERAKALEAADKEVAQLRQKVRDARAAAIEKPISTTVTRRMKVPDPDKPGGYKTIVRKDVEPYAQREMDRVTDRHADLRSADSRAIDAEDIAAYTRKDRPTRREFEEGRGVPGPHLNALQKTEGNLAVAKGERQAAEADVRDLRPSGKRKPSRTARVRRVVGHFPSGPGRRQGSLFGGPKYEDVRGTLPKQTTPHLDVEASLRRENQEMAAAELKRGKLPPGEVLTDTAMQDVREGRLDLQDVQPRHIRDDYMHHNRPEVIDPVPVTGESSANRAAARGTNQSFRKTRTYRHSAREENRFRRDEDLPEVFVEDAAKIMGHRKLQHGQTIGRQDFVDKITARGVPYARNPSGRLTNVPEGSAVYVRSDTDGLRRLTDDQISKVAAGRERLPENAIVLNEANTEHLLSEAQRYGRAPSTWGKIQGAWKSAYTVASVSYHVGNEVGNRVLSWMADVSPKTWHESRAYLKVARQRGAFERSAHYARGHRYEDTLTTRERGMLKEIELAEQTGALRSGIHQEISHLRGKSPGKLRRFSERREVQARLAVWNQARKDGLSPRAAADRVNKFLVDYGNLTDFEKRVRDAGIPFYTFWARNTKLQAGQLLQRPGKVATLEKAREDSAKTAHEDPMFAHALQRYQQAGAPFVIMLNGSAMLLYGRTPIEQGLSQLSPKDALANIAQRVGPIKIPFEIAVNYDSFRRQPIHDPNGNTAGLLPAPSVVGHLPQSLQDKLGVVKTKDGTLLWDDRVDWTVGQVPYGKAATDIGTSKSELNQYQQKPWQSVAGAAGLKISDYDKSRIHEQNLQVEKQHIGAKIERMQRLGTAYRTLVPADKTSGEYRTTTPDYDKLLKRRKEIDDFLVTSKGPEPVTLEKPKTFEQTRENFQNRNDDFLKKRDDYMKRQKARQILGG